MSRSITLIMVLTVLAVIAALVVPPIYRGMLFKRDCRELVSAAKAGDTKRIAATCDPSQQQVVETLLNLTLPTDFETMIASLKLTSWRRNKDGTVEAILTLRTENQGAAGVYQGRLKWSYDATGRRWYWNFNQTDAAEFSLAGEPEWQSLADMLETVRRYR